MSVMLAVNLRDYLELGRRGGRRALAREESYRPALAQKRAHLEAVARGLAAAVAPLNAIATTLAPQPSTRLLRLVICKLSPPPLDRTRRRDGMISANRAMESAWPPRGRTAAG
jgi:hypothetical protein